MPRPVPVALVIYARQDPSCSGPRTLGRAATLSVIGVPVSEAKLRVAESLRLVQEIAPALTLRDREGGFSWARSSSESALQVVLEGRERTEYQPEHVHVGIINWRSSSLFVPSTDWPVATPSSVLAHTFLAFVVQVQTGRRSSPYCWGEVRPSVYTDLADALVRRGYRNVRVHGETKNLAEGREFTCMVVVSPVPPVEFTVFADLKRSEWSLLRHDNDNDLSWSLEEDGQWQDLRYLLTHDQCVRWDLEEDQDEGVPFGELSVKSLAALLGRIFAGLQPSPD